ncbi:MAG: hypothetical protein ACE5JU_22950 [Candidatus Binatia bacterium]
MTDAQLELAILRRYVEHHDSVGTDAHKCARELDMRQVISSATGGPTDDETVRRWHARLAPPRPYPEGVLRPCSDSTVNKGPHRFHARAFYEPGRAPAWDRIRELENQLPAPLPAEREKEQKVVIAESQDRQDTYLDRRIRQIKNNPILAFVILATIIVSVAATFKENLQKLIPGPGTTPSMQPQPSKKETIQFAGQTWLRHGAGYVSVSKDIAEVNDELVLSTHRDEVLLWSRRAVNLDQFSFIVQSELISQAQPKGWGLVFWFQGPKNFYYFSVNNTRQFRLMQFQDGEPKVLIPWTTSSLVAYGALKVQRLGIETEGNRIRLLAEDDVLAEHIVSRSSSGSVGFYVERRGLTVHFRDVRFERRSS